MGNDGIKGLILITTLVFLIAPTFVLLYIFAYNKRKKKHLEEKALMQMTFDTELAKVHLEVQEQTMQTIGADLHDNIGQLLSLALLTLNSIEISDLIKAEKKIAAAVDLTNRSIKEMRLLGKLLQGDQLLKQGLDEAIKYEISWIEKTGQFKVNFNITGDAAIHKSSDKNLILFRITQEILNNIIKHSQATVISITLEYGEHFINLVISDNGKGFDEEQVKLEQKGMGLINIEKRIKIIGGDLIIKSKLDQGTVFKFFIPYP